LSFPSIKNPWLNKSHGFSKIPFLPTGRQVLRQPGYPRSLGPVAFPASPISGEAGPPDFVGIGVPRLLVVWLYRQIKFLRPIYIKANLMPKPNFKYNTLIFMYFFEKQKFAFNGNAPFFVLKNYKFSDKQYLYYLNFK
jgi:hypothetical protein